MIIAETAELEARLRAWAAGCYADEAAVELLIRSGWTRRAAFASDCTHHLDGGAGRGVDWQALGHILGGERDSTVLAASGGEQRVLRIAHSIARGQLADTLPGLDRHHLHLVLAAAAHAGGSHEHNGPPTEDPDGPWVDEETGRRTSFPSLGSLHPWEETQQG